jgi:DNA repair protein RadC
MSKHDKDQNQILGHRQRIKDRFIAGDDSSKSDEALLELLLTYAIPQKDVKPLAKQLLAKFGSMAGVLGADVNSLCKVEGIKLNSAVLLKLVDHIRSHRVGAESKVGIAKDSTQTSLFDLPHIAKSKESKTTKKETQKGRTVIARSGTGLFGEAALEEAIVWLPKLPDTESFDEIGAFLRKNLPFSAQSMRERVSNYILRRMFPSGIADSAMRLFARKFAGKHELQDVAFYRFCNAEPLMFNVIQDVLLPAIGTGTIARSQLRDYLAHKFPGSKSVSNAATAIPEALEKGGVANRTRDRITFAYRDIPVAAFAFVLHSEFPEPGMYGLAKLENNRAVRAMMWNPDRILPTVYELRNLGLISKVSEIDSVRQFTTRYTLSQVVEELARKGEPG